MIVAQLFEVPDTVFENEDILGGKRIEKSSEEQKRAASWATRMVASHPLAPMHEGIRGIYSSFSSQRLTLRLRKSSTGLIPTKKGNHFAPRDVYLRGRGGEVGGDSEIGVFKPLQLLSIQTISSSGVVHIPQHHAPDNMLDPGEENLSEYFHLEYRFQQQRRQDLSASVLITIQENEWNLLLVWESTEHSMVVAVCSYEDPYEWCAKTVTWSALIAQICQGSLLPFLIGSLGSIKLSSVDFQGRANNFHEVPELDLYRLASFLTAGPNSALVVLLRGRCLACAIPLQEIKRDLSQQSGQCGEHWQFLSAPTDGPAGFRDSA
ncbi:hypothetical protein Tco_1186509 [Tanacetum coccineum]